MNLHTLTVASAPHRPLPFAILRIFAVVAALAGFASAAMAVDPTPPSSAAPGLPDIVLARSALAALDAEAELKGVNLVVSVVDSVAVIGGPVPNIAVSRRAERVIRAVEGMKDVRNTCFISTGPDPLLKAVAVKAGLPPRPVMGELPGVLTNQLPAPVSPFPPNTVASAIEMDSTVVAQKPPLSAGNTGNILGAPVGPVGTAAPTSPALPTTAPGTLTSAPAAGLLNAASDMRKTEARFTNLTVDLQGGVLMVGGSAPRASDAWDFAQKLRQMPGVSRVAVGAVAGK
jgi:hypothetical protein